MPDSAGPVRPGGAGRDDCSLGRVPGEARDSWPGTALQRFAQLSTPSQFLIGATLGTRMPLGLAVLAIVLGLVILEAIIILTGVMGAREGLSTTLLARWTGFGNDGSALAGLVIAVTSAGWSGVQDSFFAQSLAGTLGGLPLWAWSLTGGALVTILVLRGFALMRRVPFVTVPGFLLLVAYTAYRVLRGNLISHPVTPASPGPPLSLGAGATVVVGGFIVGAVLAPDMTRWNRGGVDVVKQTAAGVTAGECVCLTGVLLAHAAKTAHIVAIVTGTSGVAGAIIIVAAVVAVNNWNLYSASLATVNAVAVLLPGRRPSRTAVTIVMGAAGSVLSAAGIISKFVSFLTLTGVVIPPIAGIMIAEYFVVATWRGRLDASRQRGELPGQPPGWVLAGLAVWVISAAAGYWVHAGIPALTSILLAFLLYAAAGKLRLARGYSRTVSEAQPQLRAVPPDRAAEEEA